MLELLVKRLLLLWTQWEPTPRTSVHSLCSPLWCQPSSATTVGLQRGPWWTGGSKLPIPWWQRRAGRVQEPGFVGRGWEENCRGLGGAGGKAAAAHAAEPGGRWLWVTPAQFWSPLAAEPGPAAWVSSPDQEHQCVTYLLFCLCLLLVLSTS